MSIELTQAETNTASIVPMLATEIKPRPLSYSLNDYHHAGVPGSVLHAQWQDKPHRLLYDLIAAVAYYAGKQPAPQPAQATQAEVTDHVIRKTYSDVMTALREENRHVIGGAVAIEIDMPVRFARAILALRPVQVPMTDEQWLEYLLKHANNTTLSVAASVGQSLQTRGRWVLLQPANDLRKLVERAYGITAQDKKGGV
jgi:hypothetical protein